MKVLITRSSENQTTGGAELSARDQAVVLQRLGHTPVFSSNNRAIRHSLQSRSIQTAPNIYLQRFRPPIRYVYFWLMLPVKALYDLLLVMTIRPEVINPHTREDQITYTLLKPLHRRPVVWKDPGDMVFVLRQSHGRLGSIYKNIYLYAVRRADHIYMLNDDHVSELLNSLPGLPSDRVSSVPSSIMYSDYTPGYSGDASSGLVTVGAICRLAPSKDVTTLIKAYQIASASLPHLRLMIVGDGPERASLESLAGGDETISFAGNVDKISPMLNQIDIFVNPATEEGWGRNIKEAMYFGKAVIGSRTGGIKQQIDDGVNGLLFEAGDIDTLARHIQHLADDKTLRERLGQAARSKAESDGDFTRIVEETILPIYERAAAK